MKLLGVEQIVITNLAGAINKEYKVTSLKWSFIVSTFLLRLVTLSS